MATRKIVPRADNEGGLGTALKRWASAFINAFTADSATIGTLSGIVKAAAGLLSATALGSANQKFFINAAGAAPEWAIGIKVGTFTRDTALATGTQDVAGVGFKPSHIIFLASVNITSEVSIGFDDGVVHYSLVNFHGETANTWIKSLVDSIRLDQTATIKYYGAVTTLGADGFTITWTKEGAKTGGAVIHYMAFR